MRECALGIAGGVVAAVGLLVGIFTVSPALLLLSLFLIVLSVMIVT